MGRAAICPEGISRKAADGNPWSADGVTKIEGQKSSFYYGWIIVGVAIVTSTLVYGVRYSFSIFFPEILKDFGWNRGDTALMMSMNICVYGLMAPVAGTLSSRWKPKMLMPVGVIVLVAAMIGCSLARRLWHFYICFGVLVPLGTALCGWPIMSPALMNWFATRRGLIMGIGQAGGGLSFVYGLLAQYLILQVGWRSAYLTLAVIIAVVLLPLHRFVFHFHPRSKGLKAYGSEELESAGKGADRLSFRSWTVAQMVRTYPLWLLILSFFLFWGIACFMILAHQIKYAEDAGYSAVFAASIFALSGVAMLAGQATGVISDRIGREKAMALCAAATLVGILSLLAVRDTSQPWLLSLYALSFGYGAGLYSAVIFAGAADIFCGTHFGTASGMLLTGMGLGGAIGPWLGGYLYDTTGTYDNAFILCMACIALATASFWMAAPRNADKLNAARLKSRVR